MKSEKKNLFQYSQRVVKKNIQQVAKMYQRIEKGQVVLLQNWAGVLDGCLILGDIRQLSCK